MVSPKRWSGASLGVASKAQLGNLAPHDLRRTCARLCHVAGRELEQIQFLLGHVSVQTIEKYLGCKQKLRDPGAQNFPLGLRLDEATEQNPLGRLVGIARNESGVRHSQGSIGRYTAG